MSAAAVAPAAAPAAPLPILPFDDAVTNAATSLLGQADLPAGARYALVVDPLIDGVTGTQTAATQSDGAKLAELVRGRYPQFDLQPFNSANLAKLPLVLIGTFTGVNGERKTEGQREAYRICLALADLKTGRLLAKGLAFAAKEGVDLTPPLFYLDAPGLIEYAATTGYVRSCQGTRAGDPIHPAYLDAIQAAGRIAEANEAYAAGRNADALKLFTAAAEGPGGRQG